MSDITRESVEAAIKGYVDPYLETDLVSAKAIRNIQIEGPAVTVSIALGFPAKGHAEQLAESIKSAVSGVSGVDSVSVDVDWKVAAHAVQKGVETLKNIKNVIAVASGKGGVGKSTVSANLALALAAEGATVGMLDADIYGPSQPRMLGAGGQPESRDGKTLEPVVSHDVQSMSIGYLIEEDTPMIWRGPMVTQALEQLLRDTNWDSVDYLIIDLPPGTGDTQLTLAQKIPVSGAVIVTTPQDVALLDATFYGGDELPGRDIRQVPHPFVVETLETTASWTPEERARIQLIHLNHTNPLHQADSEAAARVRAAGIRLAREGGVVPLRARSQ